MPYSAVLGNTRAELGNARVFKNKPPWGGVGGFNSEPWAGMLNMYRISGLTQGRRAVHKVITHIGVQSTY